MSNADLPVIDYAAKRGSGARWWLIAAAIAIVVVSAPDLILLRLSAPSTIHEFAAAILALRWSFHALILLGGLWAFRRYRLASLPWLGAWAVVAKLSGYSLLFIHPRVIDQIVASGAIVNDLNMTLGDLHVLSSYIAGTLTGVQHGLAIWFVLAELSHACRTGGNLPTDPIAALIEFPRVHTRTFGITLLVSAILWPLSWLAIWVWLK